MLRQETKDDAALRERALAGLRRYQQAPRPAPPARHEVLREGRVALLSGEAPGTRGTPVVLIPSLINPPDVLDIGAERSLLRHLLRSGHDAMLVDWGYPSADERDLDLAGHVETLLVPLIERLERPPVLVGYCLGGTLALATAALLTARGRPPAAVATLAAPWRFSAYDADFRASTRGIWESARPVCETLGLVPMEVLQTGFWSLDPARTVAKYAAFATMDEASAAYRAFITLEDWANAGAPLTLAAGRDIVERCYGSDDPGAGRWRVAGVPVDPAALPCPTLAVASTTDRIVPAVAAPPAAARTDLALGHVGMVVGGRAGASLFRPLDAWIAGAARAG